MNGLYAKLKHHWNAAAFVLGFIWDSFMLSRIDHRFANIMLGTYLCLSTLCILALNMHEARRLRGKSARTYALWLAPIMQFCFGSLFSAYIIFYTRSASLASNWPFLVFLALLVFGNEIFRKHYSRPPFELSILFIVLFSYSIFSLPIVLGSMGPEVFLFGGFASLASVFLIAFTLAKIAPEHFAPSRRWVVMDIVFIYALFNFAYFTHLIPPVPLALKHIGVYHSLVRQDNGAYELSFEPGRWYPFLSDTSDVFIHNGAGAIYVWSAIFAPTRLSLPIFHRWQKLDESTGEWLTTDVLQFTLVGGRDDGWRGYSAKSNVTDGRWRVEVETLNRALIGRVEFEALSTTTPARLVTETR